MWIGQILAMAADKGFKRQVWVDQARTGDPNKGGASAEPRHGLGQSFFHLNLMEDATLSSAIAALMSILGFFFFRLSSLIEFNGG